MDRKKEKWGWKSIADINLNYLTTNKITLNFKHNPRAQNGRISSKNVPLSLQLAPLQWFFIWQKLKLNFQITECMFNYALIFKASFVASIEMQAKKIQFARQLVWIQEITEIKTANYKHLSYNNHLHIILTGWNVITNLFFLLFFSSNKITE